MSEPGWYPDPGGRPGHYRFWDGRAWGLSTTSELPGVAGGSHGAGGGKGPERSRGLRVGLAATAAAVVLVLVAVGALVLRERDRTVVDPAPSTSTSAPGTATATPAPSASPTPVPSPSPSGTEQPVPGGQDCPVGDPLTRQDHPEDGRVHGGGLSFLPPSSWTQDSRAAALSWAYDVGEADEQVRGTWFTGAAVGAVSVVDAADLQDAAELMVGCTASPFFYTNVTSRTDLVNEPARSDGHPAWTIRSEVRTDNPYVDVPGDVVEVTVVDLGSPESFAFFWGTAPLDDPTLIAQLHADAQGLQAD